MGRITSLPKKSNNYNERELLKIYEGLGIRIIKDSIYIVEELEVELPEGWSLASSTNKDRVFLLDNKNRRRAYITAKQDNGIISRYIDFETRYIISDSGAYGNYNINVIDTECNIIAYKTISSGSIHDRMKEITTKYPDIHNPLAYWS